MSENEETSTYFQEWYKENSGKLLNKRRQRYREDPEYASKIRDTSRGRKNRSRPAFKKARRPVPFSLDGKIVNGWTIGHLAKRIDRSVNSVRNWVSSGAMPDSPIKTDMGHRLFTDGMILVVQDAVTKRTRIRGGDKVFYQEILEGWERFGVEV